MTLRTVRSPLFFPALGVLLAVGCQSAEHLSAPAAPSPQASAAPNMEPAEPVPTSEADGTRLAEADRGAQPAVARKIIYHADVQLIVGDHRVAARDLESWVSEAGGYVAKRSLNKYSGAHITLAVTVRVPAARFKDAMAYLASLGHVTSENTASQDITDQYYDIQARLTNAQRAEQQLLAIMEKRANKLSDYLAVQREVMNVREQIERFQGRIRLWDSQVDHSTIAVVFEERKEFEPPPPPTFGSRIADGFLESIEVLWAFLQGLVVVIIVLLPWLALLALVLTPLGIWIAIRRRRKRGRK